jgi:AAT family amino acid transporter
MFVLVTLFPWDKVGTEGSPFVEIFAKLGIPAAATILNVIVLFATLSAYNSCLYSNARMLFGLAQQGNAPKFLLHVGKSGVPVRCVLFSSALVGVAVLLNFVFPGKIFMYVMSIATIAIIINWILILITQHKFHRIIGPEKCEKLGFKMPFYPYSNYITLVYLVMIVILMAFIPDMRISLFLAPVWIAIIFIGYKLKNASGKKTKNVE